MNNWKSTWRYQLQARQSCWPRSIRLATKSIYLHIDLHIAISGYNRLQKIPFPSCMKIDE